MALALCRRNSGSRHESKEYHHPEEYYGVQGGDYADNEPTKPTEPTTPTGTQSFTEPVPGDLDAYVTSIIRTAVPYLVGLVAAFCHYA